MTQQRASSVARDERAGRRAAPTEAEAAMAREEEAAAAARDAAKRVQLVLTGNDGNAVVTSANVRLASGNIPRTGRDGDAGDGAVLVRAAEMTSVGTSLQHQRGR
ncbi:hypothetical protein PR003_g10051 [Phytophthora rubi]|uniref:Uncharacterized protein n=1 Tax=Phytophthora rubi TaxID=129364 RepID=A0A6A3MNH6_9STRA|nr:hypothetical protein PR002_g9827 [Phytophthora rubi]KAE9034450.1 hypothetical protein PR001_g9727 [Phytophthora rubi]KAE9341317.1 hypothetical protein PR003_g10051 [Phytophthora rubi]